MLTVYTAKQVKVASEYVELVGMKHGGDRKSSYDCRNLKLEDIAKALGISTTGLKELLAIDKKLIPTIRELFDNGESSSSPKGEKLNVKKVHTEKL